MRYYKKIAIISIVLLVIGLSGGLRADDDMPCNAPPFLGTTVMPNILILQDNSGSMNSWAYSDITFNEDSAYYGYFRNDKNYSYGANVFTPTDCTPNSYLSNNCFPGNLLNWATMSRLDIAKKVLVGGKARSRQGNVHTLIAETQWGHGWAEFYYRGRKFYAYLGSGSPSVIYIYDSYSRSYRLYGARVQVEVEDEFTRGIIQQIADKDNDYQWDENIPRFGLFVFNSSHNSNYTPSSSDDDGGHVVSYIGEPTLNDFISSVENIVANTWTPLAEAYYEAVRYFAQQRPYYFINDYTVQVGGVKDPYYDKDVQDIIWCRKSFVILITDGESTMDEDIPGWLRDYDGDGHDRSLNGAYGSDYLDDVALWAHTNDIRGDIPGTQDIVLYTVFAFGHGTSLLRDAAINGAFIDRNGNNRPDLQIEWDADTNGVPDAYFIAQNGFELERSIRKAIEDILQRVGAASAVTIVSNTSKGEGLAMQAFFVPKLTFGGVDYHWLGTGVSYWIDEYGNLREDTDHDLVLDNSDCIVQFTMQGNETRVLRLEDTDNDGIPDDTVGAVPLTQLGRGMNAVFNVGDKLFNKDPDDRTIYTHLPGRGFVEFTRSNAGDLEDYFDLDGEYSADTIIDYIRGVDFPGLRPRTAFFSSHTWKLGDIIYSTPLIVAEPQERYDKIYRDESYAEYYRANRNRRTVVYIGANDGMLHAFNGGIFDRNNKRLNPGGYPVGDELWAYIPFNLLPHLKWLLNPDYCHVYYVDLPPKASDLKIFNPDATHKNGWGTVLLGGMRFGGTPVEANGEELRSSYFAIDITAPTNPAFMWEFTDDDLGYTTNKPAVIKVDSTWYVILTSGPTDFDGTSDHEAYVYILDARTGRLLKKFEANEDDAYFGPPAVVDVNIDYNADVVYIGETYEQGSNIRGKVYRLTLTDANGDPTTNVDDWKLTVALDGIDAPITAKMNASMDAEGHLWVFGGTGKYWSDADEQEHPINYLFGFKDDGWKLGNTTYSFGNLLDATNIVVVVDTTSGSSEVHGVLQDTASFQTFEQWASENYDGWYVTLREERDLNMPLVIGGAVFYTTFVPTDDPCGFGGTSYLYGMYYKTGTGYQNPILGLNSSSEARRKIALGTGMASAPSAHLATSEANAQVVVQTSTGEIIQTQTPLPYKVKSGARIWRGLLF